MAKIFMRFPGGRVKALTLSYDDGVDTDIRLIELMKKSGLKGTFNLNSGLYGVKGAPFHRRMPREQALSVYRGSGMEVAVHTCTHPFLEELPECLCVQEVMQDRLNLERDFGGIVRGMAYPFGTFNDSVVSTLRQCGIAYARTVESTGKFDIPTDWLRMPATCHHTESRLMELAEAFLDGRTDRKPMLFYLWGHSYEFERDNNWEVMEQFCARMGNREEIWYATNIEVYDYVQAYKQLIYSADGKQIYNPTAADLFLQYEGRPVCVKAGTALSL